jgi:dihydrodipicolinate synthase/N-acetylneuraminate lyase
VVRGALAAAVTPLRDDGAALDGDGIAPLVDFLAEAGLDGIFALGTTGEGLLLSLEERLRAGELFAEACGDRLALIVHCGAQTTADTVALASHAATLSVNGVAVVSPPYLQLDDDSLVAHFARAAEACAPTPLYLYEFSARVGYSIPLAVIERLREDVPSLTGMKVSNAPFDRVEPYLLEGLDIFIGAESLVAEGLARGAAGTVSGLATAFPEVVAALVRDAGGAAGADATALRDALQQVPFVPAAKRVLGGRGLPLREDVRGPLRRLTGDETAYVDRTLAQWLESSSPAPAR